MQSRLLVGVGLTAAVAATAVGAWLVAKHRPQQVIGGPAAAITELSTPAPVTKSGEILFVGDDGGLHAVRTDGTAERTLVAKSPVDVPSLSPDGSAIGGSCSHHGYNVAGGWDACYARLDGSAFVVFGPGGLHALWSPDGSRFVYSCCASGKSYLYEIQQNGSTSREITTFDNAVNLLSWDTDGRSVLVQEYLRALTGALGWELKRIDVSTGVATVLLDEEGSGVPPAPSPDNTLLAFVDKPGTLRIVELTSGAATSVELPQPFTFGSDRPIVWSPDGKRIAYLGYTRDPRGVYRAPSALLVTTVATAQTTLVAQFDASLAGAVTWSPMGTYVSAAWFKPGENGGTAEITIYGGADYAEESTVDYGEAQVLQRLTWDADESAAYFTGRGVPRGELSAQNHLFRISSSGWTMEQVSSSFARSIVGVLP